MRITFVLPFVHSGGGVRVVFEYASRLESRGHQVRIVYPGPKGATQVYSQPERSLRSAKYSVDKLLGKKEYAWFSHPLHVKRIPDLSARSIPTADIVIATSNETADFVSNYPVRCGKKVYFIQDYEDWSRPSRFVDRTWRYPMHRITISDWLAKKGDELGAPVEAVIPNGIDTKLFYPEPDIAADKRKKDIIMIWRSAPQKGCSRGLKILRALQHSYPEATFSFFGLETPPSELLELGEYTKHPSQATIRRLYSAARIFFLPSFQEGFALTRMEATACGCAVVTTNAGGTTDIFTPSTAWVADKEDDKALLDALTEAYTDPQDCVQRQKVARKNLNRYTWEHSTDMLEKALEKVMLHDQV